MNCVLFNKETRILHDVIPDKCNNPKIQHKYCFRKIGEFSVIKRECVLLKITQTIVVLILNALYTCRKTSNVIPLQQLQSCVDR